MRQTFLVDNNYQSSTPKKAIEAQQIEGELRKLAQKKSDPKGEDFKQALEVYIPKTAVESSRKIAGRSLYRGSRSGYGANSVQKTHQRDIHDFEKRPELLENKTTSDSLKVVGQQNAMVLENSTTLCPVSTEERSAIMGRSIMLLESPDTKCVPVYTKSVGSVYIPATTKDFAASLDIKNVKLLFKGEGFDNFQCTDQTLKNYSCNVSV